LASVILGHDLDTISVEGPGLHCSSIDPVAIELGVVIRLATIRLVGIRLVDKFDKDSEK
jgi:hypothetical protein